MEPPAAADTSHTAMASAVAAAIESTCLTLAHRLGSTPGLSS